MRRLVRCEKLVFFFGGSIATRSVTAGYKANTGKKVPKIQKGLLEDVAVIASVPY